MGQSRIFITGGSGYVGRNLIRQFVGQGHSVVALARSPKSAEVVEELGAVAVAGDLFSPDLAVKMAGCSVLIHAAADTDHGRGTEAQRRINVDGTRAVLEAAQQAGVAQAIYISTESVLLDGSPLVNADETRPMPAKPAGVYSATKGEAERLALALNAPGFAVMAVRPRMVWGRDDTTALPQLLGAAHSGQLAFIDGGTYLTSTTHIANLCAGIERVIERGRGGEVYFITDGAPIAFRTMVTKLLETQGITAPDKTVPRWVLRALVAVGNGLAAVSGGRLQGPLTLQAYATSAVEVTLDGGKAQRELGYQPVISREDGFAEMRTAWTRKWRRQA